MFITLMVALESLVVVSLGVVLFLGISARLDRARAQELQYQLAAQNLKLTRYAQESIDTMIQRSQGLILVFQGIAGELPPSDPMRVRMESALDQADLWLQEARERATRRAATDSTGDVAFALSRASRRLFSNGNVKFSTISSGEPQMLEPRVADEVYRIGVEALTNVLRHAHASSVEVEVTYEGPRFRLCVRDDGCGLDDLLFSPAKTSHFVGLQRMRQAARCMGGLFCVWSRKAAGTEVELVVPALKAYCHMSLVPRWLQATVFRQFWCP